MAVESVNERNRETAGIDAGNVTPRRRHDCSEVERCPGNLPRSCVWNLESGTKRSLPCAVAQLLQKYQVMPYRTRHGGMLTVRNAKLVGSFLYDLRERSIMSVAHKRTQVMDHVMIEPARQPTHHWIGGCVVCCRSEDVIHAVFELVAAFRKIRVVHGVCRLKDQGYT